MESNGGPRGEIVIYEPSEGQATVEVRLEDETVWLSQRQMSELFQKDVRTINEHIKTLYAEGELGHEATIRDFQIVQIEGKRRVKRSISFYNLDVIISVGYRVKSHRGTQFRIWAAGVLRDHIIRGYTINQRRLMERSERYRELQDAVALVGDLLHQRELEAPQAEGLLRVVTDYAYALSILDDYDHQRLTVRKTTGKEVFRITYEAAREAIDRIAHPSLDRRAHGLADDATSARRCA